MMEWNLDDLPEKTYIRLNRTFKEKIIYGGLDLFETKKEFLKYLGFNCKNYETGGLIKSKIKLKFLLRLIIRAHQKVLA